jgi:hypothetical protein
MAKPRVFVSSTYYDLKYFRTDIERFIKEQGFEAVLNEKGHIPYGSTERLEDYCYKEIELCDILISIIGGRFGSQSKEQDYSVSNLELKTAIDKGKQVYIFIEQAVHSEYRTYEANKQVDGIIYTAVDDKRIYRFIEEVYALPLNNQIKSFNNVHEITVYLKEQWAGLFQRLLSERSRQKEVNLIEDLKNTSTTLNQLVEYLIKEKSRDNQAITNILLSNHPVFDQIRRELKIPYRIFFLNFEELGDLLKARHLEDPSITGFDTDEQFYLWKMENEDLSFFVNKCIFDEEGKLKIFTPSEWNQKWIGICLNDDDSDDGHI